MSFEEDVADLDSNYYVTLRGSESDSASVDVWRYQIFISGSSHFLNNTRLSAGSRAQDVISHARRRLAETEHEQLPAVPQNPDGDALARLGPT